MKNLQNTDTEKNNSQKNVHRTLKNEGKIQCFTKSTKS